MKASIIAFIQYLKDTGEIHSFELGTNWILVTNIAGNPIKIGWGISDCDFEIKTEWWEKNRSIVEGKLRSLFGITIRIFARKCEVRRINKLVADSFLDSNHLKGSTTCKHKLGLFYGRELVAVATFAAQRQFDEKRSAELIRYCTKNGVTVVGGLDKLLKAYSKEFTPDNIMTYIDYKWGTGEAFYQIGFKKMGTNYQSNKAVLNIKEIA